MPEMILARVLRCRFCQREMTCAPLTYEQNPFCSACLPERVAQATPAGGVRWRREGSYFTSEVAETPLEGEPPRRGA
jgi:hypothetical protein